MITFCLFVHTFVISMCKNIIPKSWTDSRISLVTAQWLESLLQIQWSVNGSNCTCEYCFIFVCAVTWHEVCLGFGLMFRQNKSYGCVTLVCRNFLSFSVMQFLGEKRSQRRCVCLRDSLCLRHQEWSEI